MNNDERKVSIPLSAGQNPTLGTKYVLNVKKKVSIPLSAGQNPTLADVGGLPEPIVSQSPYQRGKIRLVDNTMNITKMGVSIPLSAGQNPTK